MDKCSEMETYCLGNVLYSLIDKSYRIVFAIWHAEIRLAANVQQMPEQNSIIIYGIESLGPRLFLCHISHQRRPMCMDPKQNVSGIAHSHTHTHRLRAWSGYTENRNSRIYRSKVNAHDNSPRTKMTLNSFDWSWAYRWFVYMYGSFV